MDAEAPYDKNKHLVREYLENHNIHELMQHLLSLLAYHQPEDPRAFLLQELRHIQSKSYNDLVSESDLETMFKMIDLNRTECISCGQIKSAMKNLGLSVPPAVADIPNDQKMNVTQWKATIGSSFDLLDGTMYGR
eukprot:GGOE01054236.1.p1 GENE.GGOE01054236.1~~GGOE01054236.1.p1  ORF type:complete len:135 (+),score=29.19 GGOE01054236.1:75-479(+)